MVRYCFTCTIGPDPKPICTGTTLHSIAVTHGKLQFYKLYAHTYDGGISNCNLKGWYEHTEIEQQLVNLFDLTMISLFVERNIM